MAQLPDGIAYLVESKTAAQPKWQQAISTSKTFYPISFFRDYTHRLEKWIRG